MYNNNIQFFYDEENHLVAEIHAGGQLTIIKNPRHIKKLIDICYNYDQAVDDVGTIYHNIFAISNDYKEYIKKEKRMKVLGNITPDMKLSRKNPLVKKILMTTSLSFLIATAGLAISSSRRNQPKEEITIESFKEKIPEEDIERYHNSIKEITDVPSVTNEIEDIERIDIIEEPEIIKIESIEETNQEVEIEKMFEEDTFHFSYENRRDTENIKIQNANRYEDIFEKYGKQYGVDKNLLIAMSAQEGQGLHYENIGKGPAEGIMQIEKSAYLNQKVSAYNFNTQQIETILVTEDKLQDLDSNIQIGTMILRNLIEENNYNIPLAIQAYNFGYGNMDKSLTMCSELENISKSELRNNPKNVEWLQYREFLHTGDAKYVEHVFSFLPSDITLEIKNRNNENISFRIINDYVNQKQK